MFSQIWKIVLNDIFFSYKSGHAFIKRFAFVKTEHIAEEQRDRLRIHLTFYLKSSGTVHLNFNLPSIEVYTKCGY